MLRAHGLDCRLDGCVRGVDDYRGSMEATIKIKDSRIIARMDG